MIDRVVLPIGVVGGDMCTVALEAAGTRLDLNAASADMLDSLFAALGVGEGPASTMSTAAIDWRTTHGAFDDVRQLLGVGGFDNIAAVDSVLWAEPGRVSLATAGIAVLMTVPGITRETAERIVELRDAGTPVADIITISGTLSHTSADAMMEHYPEIVRLTTPDPEAWILTVTASVGFPASNATVQWRLVRTGKRCVVVRTRSNL
jgi:DNA uptake protein ComE-like DNA-binding protein